MSHDDDRRRTSRRSTFVKCVLSCTFLCVLTIPAHADVDLPSGASGETGIDGVTYTLSPAYEVVRWDEELGLEDTELWGGRLAFDLGDYVSLRGHYLQRDDVRTMLEDVSVLDASGILNQDIDIRNYGTSLKLNLGRGNVTPFLTAGGGVMRFDAADGADTRQISLRLGGGIGFGIDRMQGEVFIQDLAVRLDRYDLAAAADDKTTFPDDPDSDELRHNLLVGFGLNIRLGGFPSGASADTDEAIADRYRNGLTGLSVPIEPFVGRLNFASELPYDTQELAGVRAGVDLGPFFGLRGYYWRGLNDDLDDTDAIQSWGGEARFNLSAGHGAIPYLVAGAGQLDFLSDYELPEGKEPTDRTMLILGAGLGLTVGDRLKVDFSVRDHVFSERDFEDVTGTEELRHNWGLAGGLSFAWGGSGGGTTVRRPRTGPDMAQAETTTSAEAAADTTAARERTPAADMARAEADRDREPAAPMRPAGMTLADLEDARRSGYIGRDEMAIRVPSQGEIYIRYGAPGGVQVQSTHETTETPAAARRDPSAATTASERSMAFGPADTDDPEMLRRLVREEIERATGPERRSDAERTSETRREAPEREPAAPPEADDRSDAGDEPSGGDQAGLTSDQRLELLEYRLAELIDERIDSRLEDRDLAAAGVEIEPQARTSVPRAPAVSPPPPATAPAVGEEDSYSWGLHDVRAYTGVNVDNPEQVVFGGLLNLGPITRDSAFEFVPELGIGFGSGTSSLLIAGNVRHEFRNVSSNGSWTPFVGAGIGILRFGDDVDNRSSTEGVLNLSYGVQANFGDFTGFAEHHGVDLFDLNRILVGARWGL